MRRTWFLLACIVPLVMPAATASHYATASYARESDCITPLCDYSLYGNVKPGACQAAGAYVACSFVSKAVAKYNVTANYLGAYSYAEIVMTTDYGPFDSSDGQGTQCRAIAARGSTYCGWENRVFIIYLYPNACTRVHFVAGYGTGTYTPGVSVFVGIQFYSHEVHVEMCDDGYGGLTATILDEY